MLIIDKIYNYNPTDYDDEGWRKDDSAYPLFYHIDECQKQFYTEFTPFVANILFVNPATALLLHKCYQFSDNEILGMDMINGEIDFEANSQMEKHGRKQLIYGVGCSIPGHDDQPVLVVLDDKLKEGEFRLSYYQDYDQDDDGDENPMPGDGTGKVTKRKNIRTNII